VLSEKSARSICEKIVEIVREERERQGLSKYALAEKSGISQQMIGYIERGMRSPSLEILLRLSSGLGLELPDLLRKAQLLVQKSQPKSK
jgi:putative transcriptional regulator